MTMRAVLVNSQHNSVHGAIDFELTVPYANRVEFSRMRLMHAGLPSDIFDDFATEFFHHEPNAQKAFMIRQGGKWDSGRGGLPQPPSGERPTAT